MSKTEEQTPTRSDLLKAQNTASWAKQRLKILADMMEDHGAKDYFVKEIREIRDRIEIAA